MALLAGKKALVLGVLNEHSIAWGVARNLVREGATVGFSFMPNPKIERRCRATVAELEPEPVFVEPCDVSRDDDLARLASRWREVHGDLDILVHSIAFAPATALAAPFLATTRQDFLAALDVSAYSLVALCRECVPMMNRGASVITMSYLGAARYMPGYRVMGIAKAALESTVRYLAGELGGVANPDARGIRVNAISSGPIPTMASRGVGDIDRMLDHYKEKSCLGRTVDQDEIGRVALFLASDLSSGVTGEVLYADAGYRIVGW